MKGLHEDRRGHEYHNSSSKYNVQNLDLKVAKSNTVVVGWYHDCLNGNDIE